MSDHVSRRGREGRREGGEKMVERGCEGREGRREGGEKRVEEGVKGGRERGREEGRGGERNVKYGKEKNEDLFNISVEACAWFIDLQLWQL